MQEGKFGNKELFSAEPLKWAVDLNVLGFAGYQVIQGTLSIGMLVVLYQFSSQLMSSLQNTYIRPERPRASAIRGQEPTRTAPAA